MRYFLTFMGGFFTMFAHIYLLAGRGDWFAPQRLAPALGNALIFAHIFALMVFLVRDSKLTWPLRILAGICFGVLAWWAHLFFYLYQTAPNIFVLFIGGIGLAAGFIIAGIITLENRLLRFSLAFILTAIATYAPISWSYQNFLVTITHNPAQALLYFQADNPDHVFFIGIPFALCIAFFGNLALLLKPNSSLRAAS